MLTLYWHCLDLTPSEKTFVADALEEFVQLLERPPTQVEFKPMSLSEKVAAVVDGELRHPPTGTTDPFRECYGSIAGKLPAVAKWEPLLVCCSPYARIAAAAKRQCPHAVWGLSIDSAMSAVYHLGNKYIIWHEALHLWGAKDCYSKSNPNAGPNCELRNCIMQYAPRAGSVGRWPFLCEKNVDALRALSQNAPF